MLKICSACGSPNAPGSCSHWGRPLTSSKLGASLLLLGVGLAIGATSCISSEADYGIPDTGYLDADGDDYSASQDCDDDDPAIYPGAPETAGDGVDSNCDGEDDT
ncbi:MAG: hypothetical protein ACI9VR_002253 [Cognaticolwellia sp.]|jgi:hypothetical protein